jgi:SNF2 family DNA or RNA helicase
MTATPVENSLAELWNIVDFLLPGYLASLREFHREYILAWQNGSEADRTAISERLIQKLQPILLRRLKHEALDLPEKRLTPSYLPMSPLQERLYKDVIRQLRTKEIHALAAVRQLLYACAHPGLLDPAHAAETCPKLEYTLQTLEAIQAVGDKALIFTGSLQLQTILRRNLEKRFGVPIEIVNGSTPAGDRQKTIDRFSARTGFAVLLLSPRACIPYRPDEDRHSSLSHCHRWSARQCRAETR